MTDYRLVMVMTPEEEDNYTKNNPHIFYSPLDPKFAKNYNKYVKNIEDHTYITCNHCNMKVQRRSMPRHLTSKRCLIKQLILEYNESKEQSNDKSPLEFMKDIPEQLSDNKKYKWIMEHTTETWKHYSKITNSIDALNIV